ncbi:hypothetical protein DBR06_SOUSAS610068, partial [Sousa chinensis]
MGRDEEDVEMFMKQMRTIKRKFRELLLRNCLCIL